MKNQTIYDVIIIGGGAAGVGAAVNLSKEGLSYVVLQAKDRIGGRAVSQNMEEVYVDLGASWIHSYCQSNPISRYAEQLQIKQLDCSDRKGQFIVIDAQSGKQVDKQLIGVGQQKCQDFFTYCKQVADKQKSDLSVSEATKKFVQQTVNICPSNLRQCIYFSISKIQGYQASNVNELSAKQMGFQVNLGQDFIPEGGYGQIYRKIANFHNIHVQLNKVVKTISYGKQKVTVQCKDGSVYTSTKIISSLPLGVLKSKKIKFRPQLPFQYQTSIQRLGYGLMNKIIVQLETNFCGQNQWITIISKNSSMGRFTHIFNCSQKGKNILCCFLTGNTAKKYQQEEDQTILKDFLDVLKSGFRNVNIKIKRYIITRWGKDQFSMGSYSSFRVGSSPQDCQQLRKPIQQTLWMVGEHCEAEGLGTAHGAFKTGELAAQQVIESLQKSSKLI